MGKNITMKDVAEQLGVSTVTVSKALSDREGVSDAVRETVKQKAEEMGYRYNFLGKSMKEGMNYNIGILIAEQFMNESAFYAKMYQTIVKDLLVFEFFGILEVVTEEDESEGRLPHILQNNKVDGIIILGQMHRSYLEKIAAVCVPFIFLDFSDDNFKVDTIISDSFYGAYEITNYLINLGHKDIGFLGNINATSSIMDRYIGYYKSLKQNRIEINEEWILSDRDDHGKFTKIRLPEVMPSAFVCNCDEVAYRFIIQLKKAGYRIPEDISVVGYDNYLYATLSDPAITTVEVNVEAMSEAAVNSIIKRIKHPTKDYGRKVVSGRIIYRDSAKAAGNATVKATVDSTGKKKKG
ncbi:MAG: transcriptional regulator [Herbinix sp.]|jgi:LacI family transcriptional regulator|nr:transcriptional regulator [Herbinix sp.]